MRHHAVLKQLLDLTYPSYCAACGKPSIYGLCATCFEDIASRRAADDGARGFRAAGDYQGVLRRMVLSLKDSEKRIARPLAALMLVAAGNAPEYLVHDAVCFVPSTRRKVAARGFNPAEALARALCEMLDAPLLDALTIARPVEDQDRLPARRRWANVRGAFACGRTLPEDGRLLLVDDVLTTGATAAGCAAALTGAGAARVSVLVAARATLRRA